MNHIFIATSNQLLKKLFVTPGEKTQYKALNLNNCCVDSDNPVWHLSPSPQLGFQPGFNSDATIFLVYDKIESSCLSPLVNPDCDCLLYHHDTNQSTIQFFQKKLTRFGHHIHNGPDYGYAFKLISTGHAAQLPWLLILKPVACDFANQCKYEKQPLPPYLASIHLLAEAYNQSTPQHSQWLEHFRNVIDSFHGSALRPRRAL